MMQTIVSIGAGYSQLPLIRTAKKLGYCVISVDRNPQSVGFDFSDVKILESTYNTLKVMESLRNLTGTFDLAGVVARTSAQQALCTAAAIAKEFHLKGLDEQVIGIATEKSLFREFCQLHNIPAPQGHKINIKKYTDNLSDIIFPVILKPNVTIIGKRAIYYCEDSTQLKNYLSNVAENSGSGYIECQSYIEGIDVSCLIYANYGQAAILGYWDELNGINSDYCVAGIGQSAPSVIVNTEAQTEVRKMIEQLVGQFNNVAAFIFASFRIAFDGRAYLIEIHVDLGGDLIADVLFPKGDPDFNFFSLVVENAVTANAHLKMLSFLPTLLLYSKNNINFNQLLSPSVLEYEIFQKSSVIDNLTAFLQKTEQLGLALIKSPLHRKWYKSFH